MTLASAARSMLAIATLLATPALAQGTRGEITGTVTDSSRGPLVDVDVFLRGAARRTRTDSAGHYRFAEVEPHSYSLIARRIGYEFQEAEVVVRPGASARQDFTLGRRVVLPEVVVREKAECPMGQTIRGFFCRQERGGGTFLDYPEIDYQGLTYTAELFAHIRGFRVGTRRSASGFMEPVPVKIGAHCTRFIVDGRVYANWNGVPTATKDITAIEAYVRPDSIPPEVRREMLFGGAGSRACDAVVIWTRRADQ